MKESNHWMELWGDDDRWYDWNSATKEMLKIIDHKRLINKLAELQENEEKNLSKIAYLRKELPPLYTKKEVAQLQTLVGEEVNKIYWDNISLFTVTEPKRIEVNKLVNHPFNAGIYGESEDVTELANQIKLSGWVKPLIINLKGEILGGNRRKLAIELLAKEGYVILEVDIEIKRFSSPEEELQFLILDNASRTKTPYQKGREAQYLKMTWETIAAKDSTQLKPEQQWFIEQWNAKKQEISGKKGTGRIKSRDIIGALTGMSGDQHRKLMKVMWLIDVLKSIDRPQEAEELVQTLNEQSITKAFEKYQEWQEENPTDYIYTGEQYGELSPDDKVEFCHSIKDNDPHYCYVRLNSKSEPIRVLRKFLMPVNKKPSVSELSKSKPKAKRTPKPKFQVGDRILYRKQKGVVIEIDGEYYGLELDQGQIVRKASEEMLSQDNSWNPDDFGDIDRQQEKDGQGVVFQEEGQEPPDPDDFETRRDYEIAYEKWNNKPESGNGSKHPLTMEDFKVGEFYSNGHSIARLLSKGKSSFVLQWIGMGDSPAPMGCDYYPTEGVEVELDSKCRESLQPYNFDPFEPPPYVERKLQPEDQVCPKWNKVRKKGKGHVIGYSDGLVLYQEDTTGEEYRLSEDKLFLLAKDGFSVGDRVNRLIPGFPWEPQAEGEIIALFSVCCDVKYEGFETPCRLMYAWIDRVHRQLAIESKSNSDVMSCHSLSELRTLLNSDWFKSLEEADIKAIIESLWVQLSEQKF